MSSWGQVLAGITHVPSEEVLETLFYKQVKNSRSILHDLNEYHRAEEGSAKHSYKFLLEAVRRHLDRESREPNRDRAARSLAGDARASTPAAGGEKKQYIPEGNDFTSNGTEADVLVTNASSSTKPNNHVRRVEARR